jgi:hypothetical protein
MEDISENLKVIGGLFFIIGFCTILVGIILEIKG